MPAPPAAHEEGRAMSFTICPGCYTQRERDGREVCAECQRELDHPTVQALAHTLMRLARAGRETTP